MQRPLAGQRLLDVGVVVVVERRRVDLHDQLVTREEHVPDREDVDQGLALLADHRRANVAITRARRALFIVGDGATLSADGFYAALFEHCEKAGALRSAWELM